MSQTDSLILDWAKVGYSSGLNLSSLSVNDQGEVYQFATFTNTVDVDPGVGQFNVVSNGATDIVVFKCNSLGQFIWSKRIGGLGNDYAERSAIDQFGNIFFSGFFTDSIDADPGPGVYNLISSNPGTSERFIIKLDPSGNFVWARKFDYALTISAMECDSTGALYYIGEYSDSVDFDPGPAAFYFPYSSGPGISCASKLSSDGNFSWAVTVENYYCGSYADIALAGSNAVYISGSYSSTMDFDPGPGVYSVSNLVAGDAFVLKLDTAGVFNWVRTFNGNGVDMGGMISADYNGNIALSGLYTDSIDFDPGIGVSPYDAGGSADLFFVKLDPNGDLVWVTTLESIYVNDWVTIDKLHFDSEGNLFSVGSVKDASIDLDPGANSIILTELFGYVKRTFIHALNEDGSFRSIGFLDLNDVFGVQAMDISSSDAVYLNGRFYSASSPVDLDPGSDQSFYTGSKFTLKLNNCISDKAIDSVIACEAFTWIDGITHFRHCHTDMDFI